MMKPSITVAILGGGRIAYVHAKTIQLTVPFAQVKWIYDPYLTTEAKTQFSALGINHFTDQVADILNDPTVSVVYVCTPTPTHANYCIQALKAHKHVFCEKPISLDLAEILEVEKAVNVSKCYFTVGHNRRFDHNFQAIKQAIDNKFIGQPLQISITSRDPGLPPISYLKTSGGLFYDMMIHDLDMALFLMNKPVKAVYAHGSVFFDERVKTEAHDVDTAIVNLIFADDTMAVISNCRVASYGYDQRVEVLGTKGVIHINNDQADTLVHSSEAGIVHSKPLYFFLERYEKAYSTETQDFLKAIADNTPVSVTLRDGYTAVLLAAAATKSLHKKRLVFISEFGDKHENS